MTLGKLCSDGFHNENRGSRRGLPNLGNCKMGGLSTPIICSLAKWGEARGSTIRMRTWRPTREFQLLTVGLVAIQRLDGQQDVLVLQVFNVREDRLELWAEKAEMVAT